MGELKNSLDRFHREMQYDFLLRLKLQMNSDSIQIVDTFPLAAIANAADLLWFSMVILSFDSLEDSTNQLFPLAAHRYGEPENEPTGWTEKKWNKLNENILVYLNEPYHHWNIAVNKLEGANHIIILISNVRIMELVSGE